MKTPFRAFAGLAVVFTLIAGGLALAAIPKSKPIQHASSETFESTSTVTLGYGAPWKA